MILERWKTNEVSPTPAQAYCLDTFQATVQAGGTQVELSHELGDSWESQGRWSSQCTVLERRELYGGLQEHQRVPKSPDEYYQACV